MFNLDTFRSSLNKVLLGALFVGVFIGSAMAGYFLFAFLDSSSEDEKIRLAQSRQKFVKQVPSSSGISLQNTYNLLLLGYGGAGHDGGYLTDVIKVINIDPEKKEIIVISIPRDLWIELPIRSDKSEYFKINAAYAIGFDDRNFPLKEPQYKGEKGAMRMIKEALEKATGIPIDYYLAVDFSGFKKAIDILGGVEVNVPVTFDDHFYPVKGLENEICGKSGEEIVELHEKYSGFQLEKQFECRYEQLHFEKGKQTMDGGTALKLVRSRHSETHGGDFARAQRQLAVLLAIKNKTFSAGALDDLSAFINQFTSILKTDLSGRVAQELLKDIPDITEFKVLSIELTDENVLMESKSSNGQYILVPKEGVGKWEAVHEFIKEGI